MGSPVRTAVLARRGLGVGLAGAAGLVLVTAMSPSPPPSAPGPALARVVSVSRLGGTENVLLDPAGGGSEADVAVAARVRVTVGGRVVGARGLVPGSLWRLSYNASGRLSRARRVG